MKVACVVEGHGEVQAVPVLLRRLCDLLAPDKSVEVLPPMRVKRQRVVKDGELERHVELLSRRVGEDGLVLVLLDADGDCPATLGPALLARAAAIRADRRCSVILVKQEYEAWFLASAPSLRGKRGIPSDFPEVDAPEEVRSPKGRMPASYSETVDQPALTAALDLALARRAPSFDKLCRDLERLLG